MVTARELYEAIQGMLAAGVDTLPVTVFEARSGCSMPVQGFSFDSEGLSLIVDAADS